MIWEEARNAVSPRKTYSKDRRARTVGAEQKRMVKMQEGFIILGAGWIRAIYAERI